MRRGRQPLFTSKTLGGSEWEGEKEQGKRVSCCVGIMCFSRGRSREDSADEKTFKRKSWRGEGLCRELKSISGRGKGSRCKCPHCLNNSEEVQVSGPELERGAEVLAQ